MTSNPARFKGHGSLESPGGWNQMVLLRVYENHWFPVIRPYILTPYSWGGGPARIPLIFFHEEKQYLAFTQYWLTGLLLKI